MTAQIEIDHYTGDYVPYSFRTVCLLLKCLSCGGEGVVTYEVCQESQTVVNCSANQECFQVEVRSKEGANETRSVAKGCLNEDKCDAYRKGDITDCSNCKGECCSNEDECNKGNLLTQPGLKCSSCSSNVSYEDCQKKLTVVDCIDPNEICYQVERKYEKGDKVTIAFAKGCLSRELCNARSKGDIDECTTKAAQGYSMDHCKTKCCSDGNECNKGNLLSNQGSAFVISVMVLLLSVLLTLGSVNDFVKLQFL